MRKTFIAIVATSILSAIVLASGPATASVAGVAEFNCNVYLPLWPTQFGGPVHCLGNGTAVLQGKTSAGKNYTATGVNKSFDGAATYYNEKCTGNEALNGSAGGTTHFYGLAGGALGQANAHTPFAWTRVGLTAVIALPPGGVIQFTGGAVAFGNGTGRAVAAFRPVSPAIGTRTCTKPGSQTAQITGVALFTS